MVTHYRAPLPDELALSVRQENILKLLEAKPLAPQVILVLLKEEISDRTLRRDLQDLKEKAILIVKDKAQALRGFLALSQAGHNPDIIGTFLYYGHHKPAMS